MLTEFWAVYTLLCIYFEDKEFAAEFNVVVRPFVPVCERVAEAIFLETQTEASTEPLLCQMERFWDALATFLYDWKLRSYPIIAWVYCALIVSIGQARGVSISTPYDAAHLPDIRRMPPEDVPLERLALTPVKPFVPPLEIHVPALALAVWGRKGVLAEIRKRLRRYEDELKSVGLEEVPSHLERHARWWFEHFVHGKKYDDIAQEEIHTPGGSLVSYAGSVGDAVRRFSRLIRIDIRSLSTIR